MVEKCHFWGGKRSIWGLLVCAFGFGLGFFLGGVGGAGPRFFKAI